MARTKSNKRSKAYEMWLESGGQLKLKDIAAQLGVSDSQIRKWKNQDKWEERAKVTLPNSKSNVTIRSSVKKERRKALKVSKELDNESSALTAKQILFVAEYLTDFNATRAAMAVGYSKKTAHSIGWENLRKPEIQAEISRQKDLVISDLGITTQRLLLEYLKIAFADITNFVEFGQKEVPVMGAFGPVIDKKTKRPFLKTISYVAFKESTELDGTLISEVKQGKDGVSIKLHDKMKALEKLDKYLDLLPDHHKRMIENEKLKLEQARLELDKVRAGEKSNMADQIKAAIEKVQQRREERIGNG